MKLSIGDPANPDITTDQKLFLSLIYEEYTELQLALSNCDKLDRPYKTKQDQTVAVADALGDLAYTVAGAAVAWGIDLAGVFEAIHDSNMTKTPDNKREDGKILKGPKYCPPDIQGALNIAKEEVQHFGYGEDTWWPKPTVGFLDTSKVEKILDQHLETDHNLSDGSSPGLISNPNGEFLSRGAYRFDCVCGRSHEVSTKNGTRGGLAETGHAECMCGKVFDLTFSRRNKQDYAEIVIQDLGPPGANK